jgi:membrane-associated phospholipid phosphatase
MSRRGIAIYAFFILLFGVFCYFAHRFDYFAGDVSISQWLQGSRTAWLTTTMRFAPYIVLGLVGLAMVVRLICLRSWRALIFIASTVGVTAIVSWPLKELVSRPRPTANLVEVMVGTQGLSFPSEHVALATVVCGLVFYLAPRLVRTPAVRWLLRALLIVLILAVGASRIYLGTHWTSDVVGGLFLGGLLLYPAIVLYNKHRTE